MNESWAIGLPGHRTIGTRVRLVISSVSVPLKPGSTKPAVACTINPSRPRLDLPSIRATRSSGISTYSCVRPSANSPGWITKGWSASISTSSVRFVGGSRRSIAAARWLWKTRKEPPSRRSTDAGWTIPASHGSITTRPSATRRRIVPSERTEAGALMAPTLSIQLAGARGHLARARRRERRRVAVGAAARRARERGRSVGARPLTAVAALRLTRLGLLAHGPPDDQPQRDDRQLQPYEEVEHGPLHPWRMLPAQGPGA